MNWRTITNSDLGPAGSSIPDVRDVDLQGTGDEFKKRLLWDYARGIRHNNLESTHRYRVHHDITRLLILVLSISTLGVALILMDRSVLLWPLLIVGSIISIYVIQRTLSDYRTLLNRVDDPERFSLDDYQDHHMLERNNWQDNRSEY